MRYTGLSVLPLDWWETINIINGFHGCKFGIHRDMKSHTGVSNIIEKGVIYARSTKQEMNSKSRAGAELIGKMMD